MASPLSFRAASVLMMMMMTLFSSPSCMGLPAIGKVPIDPIDPVTRPPVVEQLPTIVAITPPKATVSVNEIFDFSKFSDLLGLSLAQTPLNPNLAGLPTKNAFEAVNLGQVVPDLTVLMKGGINVPIGEGGEDAVMPVINPRRLSNIQDIVELGVGPGFERADLFEGDLMLDNDTINHFYAFGNDTAARRSVTTDPSRLWPGRNVYYTFHSSVPGTLAQTIRDAMDHWEDNTCLRFFQRTSQSDYISFQTTDDGCYSDSIGRDGGKQIINIGSGCEHFGIVVHEIGHSLGKWHEQSRPDRDSFVRINTQNIQDGKGSQFSKRSTDESDPLSVGYDYGSVMHYSRTAFSKNGQNTIDVTNSAAYTAQGSPSLGQRSGLSSRDILQINRLYTCPGVGQRGTLKLYLRYARNLPDRDNIFSGSSDPYVEITAVTATGAKYVQRSSTKDGTENPNFYEWIEFGGNTYQSFRVKIWDSDGGLNGDDDPLSISQTIEVSPGLHSYVLHCADLSCHAYMWFDWEFVVDVNECASSPCQNGGVCVDGISRYTCYCPTTYTGTNCQYRQYSLRVYARYAHNLPDEDGIWNESDPYLEIVATTIFGTTVRRTTAVKDGTANPVWNQYLDFGRNTFTSLQVRIKDSDGFLGGADDNLSGIQSYVLSPGTTTFVKVCASNGCNVGYAYFDYTLA